jgi:hypothetical protein
VLTTGGHSPPASHLHGRAVNFRKDRWIAIDTTGRDQFMISNNGTIFQRDLGNSTDQTPFDPDTNWVPVQ